MSSKREMLEKDSQASPWHLLVENRVHDRPPESAPEGITIRASRQNHRILAVNLSAEPWFMIEPARSSKSLEDAAKATGRSPEAIKKGRWGSAFHSNRGQKRGSWRGIGSQLAAPARIAYDEQHRTLQLSSNAKASSATETVPAVMTAAW